MLTRKLRVVETGKGFTVERRKWFRWENAIYSENMPQYYDTVDEAKADGIRLYKKIIIGEIKE
jgi:hypothetical protein